jgi:hypothetical protein
VHAQRDLDPERGAGGHLPDLNEGYSGHVDLAGEAIRLGRVLAALMHRGCPLGARPFVVSA